MSNPRDQVRQKCFCDLSLEGIQSLLQQVCCIHCGRGQCSGASVIGGEAPWGHLGGTTRSSQHRWLPYLFTSLRYNWYLVLLEKAMAPHSSTLAWKIPWMEEPGGLQSMGSLRVGHDWATSLSLFTFRIGEGNGNPLQCSCLENPRDRGAWWAAVHGVTPSRTWLKRLSSSSSSSNIIIPVLGIQCYDLIFLYILGNGDCSESS